jgi:hypothetical protein
MNGRYTLMEINPMKRAGFNGFRLIQVGGRSPFRPASKLNHQLGASA